MAKITCALRKEQIGLLIQYTSSYMMKTKEYNLIDVLTPLQKVVGDDIIQYASILPDVFVKVMSSDLDTFQKENSLDKFAKIHKSFQFTDNEKNKGINIDAVEKYLIDNSIIKKETLSGAKTPVSTDTIADIEKRRKEDLIKYKNGDLQNTDIAVKNFKYKKEVINVILKIGKYGKDFIGKKSYLLRLYDDKGNIIDSTFQDGESIINAKYDAELAALEAKPQAGSVGVGGDVKATIVVHGAVNGYGLQYSEGISTSDIKKPEDPRGFLPEQEQVELNKGNSIVKTDKTLDNGNKTISIITPAIDIFGRSAVSIYDFEIPTNNNSTAQGIKSIIDNVRKEDLKPKELIDETVKQVKKYIDSNAQLTTPVSTDTKADIERIIENSKLDNNAANRKLAEIAKNENIDLSKLTREEYAAYAIKNGLRISDIELRNAPELRNPTTMDETMALRKSLRESLTEKTKDIWNKWTNSIEILASKSQKERYILDEVRVLSGTASSGSWLFFDINNSQVDSSQAPYKSYFSLKDFNNVTPDKVVEFMQLLQQEGYKGGIKTFQDLVNQGVLLNDQFVMHGDTEADAKLGERLAKEFFKENIKSTGLGKDGFENGKSKSYSQILSDKISNSINDIINGKTNSKLAALEAKPTTEETTEDIEAKADIERRRKLSKIVDLDTEISDDNGATQPEPGVTVTYYLPKGKTTDGRDISKIPAGSIERYTTETKVFYGFEEAEQQAKDWIKSKYDAELKALKEQPEKKSTTRTLKKLNELLDKFKNLKLADTTEGLEKQLEEVKDDVDNFVNNEEQFGEFNGNLSSLVQSGEAKLKVEAKINGKIESIKQTEELENKKQEKKKKEVSDLSKVFDPLSSSSSQQRAGKPSIKGDKVISTQITVWTMLREIIRKGSSPTDAGYYATVMNNTLEDEYLFEDTKEALNNGIINKEKVTNGKILVITDEKGNIYYFDNNGKVTTKEKGGVPAYQNFRPASDSNRPSKEDLESKGLTEEYERQLNEVKRIRESKEPFTFEIRAITPGYINAKIPAESRLLSDIGENLVISMEGNNTVLTDRDSGDKYTVDKKKLGDTDLIDTIVALLDLGNNKGLSEKYSDKKDRRTLIEKVFNTFKPTKDGKSVRLNFENEKIIIVLDGKNLSYEDSIEYIKNAFIDIKSNNLSIGTSFEFPVFRNGEFEMISYTNYRDFISKYTTTKMPQMDNSVSYLKLGNPVIQEKEETKEETKAKDKAKDESANPYILNIKDEGGGLKNLPLERSIVLLNKTTEEQDKKAKEWFDTYLKSSGIKFNDFRDIVNSAALATWTKGAINLWNQGKYSDLYHEAYHDFSQEFLTKDQKIALYTEAENTAEGKKAIEEELKAKIKYTGNKNAKLSTLEKYHVLEELIAEDFYKYMLSEQKLILNQRPKRNTIFRKMYNFLKELFTGKTDLQTIYERLATNNVSKYERDASKAFFGKLNKKNVEGLTLEDSLSVYKAIDGTIASLFRENNLSISSLFKNKAYLELGLNEVQSTFLKNLNGTKDIKGYSQRLFEAEKEYEKASEEEKENLKPNIAQLKKIVENFSFVLNNWSSIKSSYLKNSRFLKVSSEYLPEDLDSDDSSLTKESRYDEQENINAIAKASKQLIYLIASLPAYTNVNGKKQLKMNSFLPGVVDTVDFELTFNQISSALSGLYNYEDQYNKLVSMQKENPELKDLIKSLPNPNVDLTPSLAQLRNQFINIFSTPIVPVKIVTVENENDIIKVNTYNATSNVLSKLKADWDLNLQLDGTHTIKNPSTTQNELDLTKVIKDFGVIGTSIFKENMPESKKQEVAIKFLNAIGFKLSPQAINSPEFKDYLDSKGTYEGIQSIYNSLLQIENIRKEESFNKNYKYSKAEKDWAMQPIRSVLDMISKDKRGIEENSVSKSYVPVLVKGLLDSSLAKLSEIELKYSDKFYSESVVNAGGDLVNTKRSWNQLSVMYNTINDIERYPTYQELINSPLGFIFDVNKNPDANNIYLRSVFDLETGIRRKDSKGKYVTLDLYNHDGVNVINDANRTGDKTIKLTRFDKFVQDFSSLLTGGNKEHARYGDKTTSNGTETTFPRSEGTARNSYLPVDVVSFKSTVLPEEAWKAFEASLNSAITRTNQFHAEGVGKDFDNYSKNLSSKKDGGKEEYFGFFEGILSKETKDKFLEKGLLTESNFDAKKVTESLKESVKKDLTEFLNKEVTKTKEEIKSNSLLNAKDYTDTFLLKTVENNNETLIRAFAVNAYILNMEHIRLVFTDPRFYDNKNESYTEIFKRMSKASSTGTIGTNDQQINKFLQGTRLEAIKYNETHEDQVPEKAEDGVENTVIFNDAIMTATDFIDQVDERFKNAPLVERVGIKKAYTKAKTSDAFGFCTFDFYRQWCIRTGNDNWNKEKQAIYEKIVNKESLSEDETLKAFAFFPPLKIRVVGFTKNAQGRPIPVDYKFAVSPLVGSVVQGKAFEKVKDNMIRQNVSIGLFKTASKHSSIVNDEGTHNNFYNEEDGSVNEKDYVLNPIHTEFIFEVMPSPEDYKGSVSFSTQLRKLLFVNSFKNGVPIDYKGTKDQWDALSESKKRSSSSTYLNKELFAEAIDSLVELEKNKLLDKIGAELKDGKYTYDEEKFSDLLQEEFDKRNLPQNALDSLKVVNGKFKYSLDSSTQRNTIESIIIAIVDNKLRKQKGFGESLIQNSSVGYESATFDRVKSWNSINGNDLPFYGYEGRTLPDGTKVTSAQKIKMAIQGDFKKLLNLKDVKDLANNPDVIKEAKEKGGTYTPELVALNRLIRDEKWLDKNNHRELVSTTGVRIPVQGHNSMEFMEVFEFLPEEAGPIVIVSPFLVAKSGGDFDWDKITTLFPSIHYNSYTNKVSLYNVKDSLGQRTIDFSEISRKNKQKTEKLNTFKTELKSALEEYKKDKDFAKLAKQDLKRSSRLINIEIALLNQQYDILRDLEVQYKEGEVENIDSVIEAVTGEKINFSEISFPAIISKIEDKIKEYEKINKVLLPIMERSLTSTYEELAYTRNQLGVLNDQLEEIRKKNGDIQDFIFKNNPKKAYNNQINSIIRKTLEASSNFDQLVTPNSTDMFEGIADDIQEYQEQGTKKSYSDIPSNSTSLDQFESNTVGKDSLGIGAVWNVFFSQLQEAGMVLNDFYITNLAFGTKRAYSNRLPHNKVGGKTSVSGIYSQEYKGTKYKISEAISQLMNGWVDVAKKDWIFFINGIKEIAPVMLYTLTTGIHKDVAISFFNQPVLHDFIKNQKNYTSKFLKLKDREVSKNKKAKAIYETLMKYLPDDTEIEIKDRKSFIKVNAKEYLTDILNKPKDFYSTIGTAFKKLADDNKDLFNPNEFEKFAIPVRDSKGNLTLSKPTTKQEKLAQALYLIQFLEFQEQGNVLNKLRTSINQDSGKPANLQAVLNKKAQRAEVKLQGLFDKNALNHIVNNSVIKGFTKDVGGIDDFIGNISENMFDITNHPVFNDFLKSEWEKSSESTTNNNVFTQGNNIPFETKYEIYDDWVKAFKNDFILYLYQNYIYRDNKKVGSLFFNNWSKWDTAFAAELDSIKLNFPELVENNLLLQFLQRDDSLRKNKNNKPESVSIKLKKSQLESDTIDILSNSFNDLLNFYDNEYTLDQQKEIRDFADKLADFSFVQSGLSKTPYSFSNVIPNDVYADKINRIIKAFKELMDEDATKAKTEIAKFNSKFKQNNSKFFVAYLDEQSGGMDLDFAKNETSRGKNYLLGSEFIVDLLNLNKNANELLAQKENEKLIEYIQSHSSTATEVWDKETAKNNKNNLYIYESNKSDSGMVGTAKVKGDSKNPESNTKGIALMEKASLPADVDKNKDAYFSDSKLTANKIIIDNSIKAILDNIKKRMSENKPYTNIIFPVNGIVEISFLKEKAPLTYNYLIDKLNETFGTNYQTTENTKFEVSQDAEPVIYPSTEEDDNYRGGYEDNFDYIPSQIDLSEEEQELSMINLEWDKALENAEYTLPKGKTIGEHTQAINKEFQAKVDAIKGTKPSVPTQTSTSDLPGSDTRINIYASTGENAELSNFAEREFTLENDTISFNMGDDFKRKFYSVEQAFQYIKSIIAGDPFEGSSEVTEKIANETNGAKLKALGSKNSLTTFTEGLKEWDDMSETIMYELLLASFKQNPKALQQLLATGNATLTHMYKGVEQDKGRFSKLLMEVRNELKSTQPSASVESKILNKVGDTITQVSKLKNRTVTLKGTIENIEKTEKGYDVTLKFKTYTGSRLQKVVIENGEVIKTVYKSLLDREKYLESSKNTYNFTFSKSTTPTTNIVEKTDKIILRSELKANPTTLYLFGDNDVRKGLGGQAKEMRGEPNAVGISTKKLPAKGEEAYKSDNELQKNKKIITDDINKAIAEWNTGKYSKLIIPQMGVGLAELPTRAPETYKFLQQELKRLEDQVTQPIILTTQSSTSVKPTIDTSREWKGDLESRPVYTQQGVNTMRTSDANAFENFGNPFSESGYGGTIKVASIGAAVKAYKDWLLGVDEPISDYMEYSVATTGKEMELRDTLLQDVKEKQRDWILDQINQGKLDGATLLYAGKSEARGQGMHPTALAEVVEQLRSTQSSTTEVVPPFERIRKEYPQTINVNGINLNTDKLLEFSSFGKVTEDNGLDNEEIEKYGVEAEFVSEWIYLSKEKAEWIKNNPKFSNNLADAYQNDESEEVIEQDLDLDEYSQYLLDKNVRLIDVNQLSLFDEEETDTPNCIIP